MRTTVYLIRHSEKMRLPHDEIPVSGDRIQPLNSNGERKAKGLLDVEELRGADIAYCSPFARTISTLRYLVETDGVPFHMNDALREMDFGRVPGMPMPGTDGPGPGEKRKGPPPRQPGDIRGRQWVERDLAAPGGESINQCCARMTDIINTIVRDNPGKKILIGSHGAAICAYLSPMLEEVNDEYTGMLPQPAVFCLTFEDEAVTEIRRLELPASARDE